LPPEVFEQIVNKDDGVPLFVEELTKTILESGLLKDVGDRYGHRGRFAGSRRSGDTAGFLNGTP
jgi:hypothetical protein